MNQFQNQAKHWLKPIVSGVGTPREGCASDIIYTVVPITPPMLFDDEKVRKCCSQMLCKCRQRYVEYKSENLQDNAVGCECYADAHPPATATHSAMQLPSLPSTSTISVSHLHLHPTPFSLTASQVSQYSSSSIRFFSSLVVFSRKGGLASCRLPGAFAGQCCIVVCL